MKTLYDDYKKFEELASKSDDLDFKDLNFYTFNPTTLLPLACFYNRKVNFRYNLLTEISETINSKEKNNLKILPFQLEGVNKEEFIESLTNQINYSDYAGFSSIFYISNELITNVYNHTPFNKGLASQAYVYIKEYPQFDLLDFTIMDDGLGIPGNFERHNFNFSDDCDVISKAINQVSTAKDENNPLKYSRGFGLWSTLKLVIEGNGGNALIVSRQGCLNILDKDNYKYNNLNNSNIFKGTLISLRFKKNQIQNFYDLIEIGGKSSYKY